MATKKASTAKRQRPATNKTGTEPPKRSVAAHSEHPESPGDSTVRHAGKGSFPQGEYDVTKPAKAGGAKKDPVQNAIEQSLDAEEIETIKAAQKHPKANRLKPEQRALAIEALPIGAILEHEAKFRWRVKANLGGGIRWGHGATAQEAIDNYILGSSASTLTDAGAQAFHALPASQQKEIEDRDQKAAKAQGINPDNLPEAIARREFKENAKAAQGAKKPAPNATTDGPEVASAQLEAGRKRGNPESTSLDPAKDKAAKNRSSARRRSGAKAKR